MKERKFYPMITHTLNNLLRLVEPYDMWAIIDLICEYPMYELNGDMAAKPIVHAILDELDRQYSRWNKRGDK